jgi:SAM-dependent methyltransferase
MPEAIQNRQLTAEDYAYRFPDHWLLDERTDIGAMMHHAYVQRVIEIVARSGARRVIEVGCGDGWNCGQLAERDLEVVGVDWSRNAIAYAKQLVPRARFHCGDIRDSEFIQRFAEPFDAAILVEVIEHIPPADCVAAVREIRNLIRPGGTFVLTTPSVNFPNDNPQHYRHFTEQVLRDLVAEAEGLEILDIEGYGDVKVEDWHWRLARFVNNRFYTIHPLYHRLTERYRRHCLGSSLDRCHGFIMTMRRSAQQ